MNIVVPDGMTMTTDGKIHDNRPSYPESTPVDFQSCHVCNRLMGYTSKPETLICVPCISVGFYIDEDTGMIEDKRVDNDPDHQRIKAKVINDNETMTIQASLRTTIRWHYYNTLNLMGKWKLYLYGGTCSICGKRGKGSDMVASTLCEKCLPF